MAMLSLRDGKVCGETTFYVMVEGKFNFALRISHLGGNRRDFAELGFSGLGFSEL